VSFWHIKRVLIFLLADVILLSFIRRREANTLLVIKCDLLGDYIINRNLLRAIRDHEDHRGMKIVLCANSALRDLIQTYDADAFDSFVWIDRNQFLNSFWPRFKMLREIKRVGARIAVNAIYYREPYIVDSIMRATGARERIGRASSHNPSALTGKEAPPAFALADAFYTRLMPEDSSVIFDFTRNKEFLARLFPGIQLPENTRMRPIPVETPNVPRAFAVIMPGASMAYREWPPERFAKVALYLFRTRKIPSLIMGTEGDRPKAEAIMAAAPEVPMENFCGRLSLTQIVSLIHRCEVGLTNDSGGIHIFAALDKPALAVSSTSSFGICHPYPGHVSEKVVFVYPPEFYRLKMTFARRKEIYGSGRHYSISDVPVESVIEKLETLLRDGSYHEHLQDA
jgi:ADP-heptose:LPS heptosyltransferase